MVSWRKWAQAYSLIDIIANNHIDQKVMELPLS